MGVVMTYGFYKLGQGIKEQKYVIPLDVDFPLS